METITWSFFVTLSDPVDEKKLRQEWERHARANPDQPRIQIVRVNGSGLEIKAYDAPANWTVSDFRSILAEVLFKVDEFCSIHDAYHVGVKNLDDK